MKRAYILAVDQSTQGTKALLLDEKGTFLLRRDVPHRQLVNDRGWVGHDAMEIADNIFKACAIGTIIGRSIYIADTPSIRHPAIRKTILITKSITYLLSVRVKAIFVSAAAIP